MNQPKVGDVIRYRYDYAWEYGIVTTLKPDGGVNTRIIKTKPPAGTTRVFQGCWKGEEFLVRKIVKLRKIDL